MEILIKGLPSGYEVEHLVRVFYPLAAVRAGASTKGAMVYARIGARQAVAGIRREDGSLRVIRRGVKGEECAQGYEDLRPKYQLSSLVFDLLSEETGLVPPWGMLTGVRPVRLLRGAVAAYGEEGARARLVGGYRVTEDKYRLAGLVTSIQGPLLRQNTAKSYSLYISIPFCPSRCSYCSFVSRTIEREGHLVEGYLDVLIEELAGISQLAQGCGLQLESIYVGGGTPTALTAPQLVRLLEAVHRHFDVAAVREFTVEAGRPDCTDREKLRILKQYGVGRISINPQTLSDGVLQNIGRRHVAADVARCFGEARAEGHESINMDLIAGLPGDDAEGFVKSLEGVLALGPENVTVHTLTHKRASNLVLEQRREASPPGRMLGEAYPRLKAAGFSPYYLYRQKGTVENLENTGWTREGHEGAYNIYIMEEVHTILAAGAGASTKLVGGAGRRIERVYNHKFPADYMRSSEKLQQRNKQVEVFYASDMDT